MHAETAARLRQYWNEQGNPPCRHPKIELESVSNRYLTGAHVCITCGALLTVDRHETPSTLTNPDRDDGSNG